MRRLAVGFLGAALFVSAACASNEPSAPVVAREPQPAPSASASARPDVALQLAGRAAAPAGAKLDGDVAEWSLPDGASSVAVALDATGLTLAGRLARGVQSVTVEVSSKPPNLPPVGFRQDWGVQELNCAIGKPNGEPWEPRACEAILAKRQAFVAAYQRLFRASFVVDATGVTRDGEKLGGPVSWQDDAHSARTFEVKLPAEALPEVAEAPVRKMLLEAFVATGGAEGPRVKADLAPTPEVGFEPHPGTRSQLFAAAASQALAAPMSYRPGRGMKAHAVEYKRGPEPRPLVLREVDLVEPRIKLHTDVHVAGIYPGIKSLGVFSGERLTKIFDDGNGHISPLADGVGPVQRGGGVHMALWNVVERGGCAARSLWVADLVPRPVGAPPAKSLADPPPPGGAAGSCWMSRDTWANADGTVFKSIELRVDPATRQVAVRGVVWTYSAPANRYVMTVEPITATSSAAPPAAATRQPENGP